MDLSKLHICFCSFDLFCPLLEKDTFNETKQYNINIFDKIIFFKYRSRQIKAREINKKIMYLNCHLTAI